MRIADGLRVKPGDVVTLTGGGGKTTVMFRMAEELTAAGLTVISTMTTKIFVEQMVRAPASLLLEDGQVPGRLETLLAQHRHVLIGGRIGADREKVEGVPPEIVGRLAAAGLAKRQQAPVIIVEADGSRRLPFKAPAEHEPVVPRSTTILVPLTGLDVLGQPLDQEHVHRPQLVSAIAGIAEGEPVTPEVVARVLSHPRGGAKGLPSGARLVPFLNKSDLALAGGREIARLLLLTEVADQVLVGAAETGEPVREAWGRVAAVVLAAGEGRRFSGFGRSGTLKQVMPWHGAPLVSHVVRQALACPEIGRAGGQVLVTTGAQSDQVKATLDQYHGEIELVMVEDWAEGQSRSVRDGLDAAQASARGGLSAVAFLLADQPGVSPALLSALVQRHRETLAPVVAPRHNGKRGNPVLFDRRTFGEFQDLKGDAGARQIIRAHENEVAWVEWPSDEILRDIDTPDDYATALERE